MALVRPCQEIRNQVPVGATVFAKEEEKKTRTVHAFLKCKCIIKHLNFFVFRRFF